MSSPESLMQGRAGMDVAGRRTFPKSSVTNWGVGSSSIIGACEVDAWLIILLWDLG